jgi:hypothetical protein
MPSKKYANTSNEKIFSRLQAYKTDERISSEIKRKKRRGVTRFQG